MRARIVNPTDPSCPWPMCDVTTGRRDGPLVHFGEMAPVVADAPAKEPANLHKVSRVEHVARELLGMKSQKQYAELEERNAELEAENERLGSMVEATDESRLRTAAERVLDALDGADAEESTPSAEPQGVAA